MTSTPALDNHGSAPLLGVLVGVSGCGKTTVGVALGKALGVPFVDADDLQPPANIAHMRRGLPLDDDQRRPWLDAVHARLDEAARGPGIVMACSALKHAYRERLAAGLPPLQFVHLQVDRDELVRRLQRRTDHFFPASLLDSQLALFEPLRHGIVLAAERPVHELVDDLLAHFRRGEVR